MEEPPSSPPPHPPPPLSFWHPPIWILVVNHWVVGGNFLNPFRSNCVSKHPICEHWVSLALAYGQLSH
jgi:hypothetical protein